MASADNPFTPSRLASRTVVCYLGIVLAIAIRQIGLSTPVISSFVEGDYAVLVHLARSKLGNAMIPVLGSNVTWSSYITPMFKNSDKAI